MDLLKLSQSLTFAELKQAASEVSGAEVLRLWIEKLLRNCKAVQFDVDDWFQLTNCLRDAFQQILAKPLAADEATALELCTWLCDILELLKWFHPLIPELNTASICVVLVFTLDNVLEFLKFYRKWGKDNDLKRHLQDSLSIHSFILKILNENVSNFKVNTEDEFSNLTRLIASLCEVGEQTSPLDIKTILETWKCVSKITAQCAKWALSFEPITASQKPKNDWAKRPFVFLLKEVSRNLRVIYKEDTLKQPIEQVEKYLRVTNFYLKLLQMLTTDFRHAKFPVGKEFFEVLNLSISLPKYLAGTQIAKLVQKNVSNALIDVLRIVYKNNDIRELLLSHLQKCKESTSFELARKYLDASVSGRDGKFIACNVKTFAIIFQHLVTDPAKFISDPEKLEDIIEPFAALTILSETTALKAHFRQNVLNADFATAQASTDVLMIVLRWSFDRTQPAEVLREFRFWRQCNESFALMSDNTRQWHIRRLLRHTFKLCQSSGGAISNNQLWDQYPEWQLAPSNCRFFLAVGLATTSSSPITLQSLIVRLSDELFELIKKWDSTGCSVDDYYKMVVNIELLSTSNVPPKKELVTKLFQLVTGIHSNSKLKVQDFKRLLNAFHHLAATYTYSLSESTLQQILDDIIKRRLQCEVRFSIPEIDFLSSCCNSRNRKLQESAKDILTKFDVTDLPNSCVTSPWPIYKEIYLQMSAAAPCHVCDIQKTTIQKRQRQDFDEDKDKDDGPSLKKIVNDILENSHNIVNCSTQLDNVDFNILNCVVNNLKSVLGKKQ